MGRPSIAIWRIRMNKQDILTLYKYNQWANAKILAAELGHSPGDIDFIYFLA